METIDFDKIYDLTKYLNISSIFDSVRSYHSHNGTSIEESKEVFIRILNYFIKEDKAKIRFRNDQPKYLKELPLHEQLNYIYNTFPVEYDENDPEKDIENLWWYVGCPVDIEWKLDDGTYYLSD